MKIKVNAIKIINIVLMIIMVFYALSQQSWGGVISGIVMWRLLFLGCIVFGIVSVLGIRRKFSLFTLLSIGMVIIVFTFNNQNFSNGSNGYELLFAEVILFSLAMYRKDYWIDSAIKMMLLLGVFYASMTWLSFFSKSFYDKIIYPIIASVNDISHVGLSSYYSNGFTAHYSFNGMYIALAVCLAIGFLIPEQLNGKVKNKWIKIIFVMVMFGALLLTNKRAHILFTTAGAFLAYYIYNSDKPTKRIIKILGLLIIISVVCYLLYTIMPNMFEFLKRFEESSEEAGGITNGRYQVWAIAIDFFRGKWFMGTGWWSFYRYFGAHVHNIYLQLFIETGIIGSVVFVMYFLNAFIKNILLLRACRIKKIMVENKEERYLVISLVYQTFFLLYGITGTCLYEAPTLVPYVIFCSITEHYWSKKYLNK